MGVFIDTVTKRRVQQNKKCLISDFRREVDENCALPGYYSACSGNSLLMFRDKLSASRLSRNVGKELPVLGA